MNFCIIFKLQPPLCKVKHMEPFKVYLLIYFSIHSVVSADKHLILSNNMFTNSRHGNNHQSEIIHFNNSFSFNSSNISSIEIIINVSTNKSVCDLDLLFILTVNSKQCLVKNLPICRNHQSKMFPISFYIENNPFNDTVTFIINNTIFEYNNSFATNESISVYIQLNNTICINNINITSQIDIHQIDLIYNKPPSTQILNAVNDYPDDVTVVGRGALVPYQILYDQHANQTQKEQLHKILADAIVYVFKQNGFGSEQGIDLKFDDPMDARYVIENYRGDMVLKYSQYFKEEDEDKVMNFTTSTKFETEINGYFNEFNGNDIIKTADIFVLDNEINLYYIWLENESIWKTPSGIALIVVIIVIVLSAIIIAASCLHCRRRREDFETTLPKSKAHKQRIVEMQRKKAMKRFSKRNLYAKYKAIRQNTDEPVNIEPVNDETVNDQQETNIEMTET